jgi:hypothetical protein
MVLNLACVLAQVRGGILDCVSLLLHVLNLEDLVPKGKPGHRDQQDIQEFLDSDLYRATDRVTRLCTMLLAGPPNDTIEKRFLGAIHWEDVGNRLEEMYNNLRGFDQWDEVEQRELRHLYYLANELFAICEHLRTSHILDSAHVTKILFEIIIWATTEAENVQRFPATRMHD